MDKIFELLGIKTLDEADQEVIKTKLKDIIDLRVSEELTAKLDEEKAALVESYEEKFETYVEKYKGELVENLSNFLDRILEKELEIPTQVLEYARKGELYDDVIETLKTRMAIDEGLIDDEAKAMLKEAKEAIDESKDAFNELQGRALEMEKDLRTMAAELYVRKQIDGLSESKKAKILNILSGVTDMDEINRKIKILTNETEEEVVSEETKTTVNESTVTEETEGKGHVEVETPKEELNEETKSSPFGEWLKGLM